MLKLFQVYIWNLIVPVIALCRQAVFDFNATNNINWTIYHTAAFGLISTFSGQITLNYCENEIFCANYIQDSGRVMLPIPTDEKN